MARDYLNDCLHGKQKGLICAVSLWEIELKRKRGLLPLSHPVREWLAEFAQLSNFKILSTTPSIWLRSAELDWDHRDPADRLIVATALEHECKVLSKDRLMQSAGCPVEVLW